MKKAKKNQGFSLVELIVSVSILAIMSSMFLANYKSANRQAELNSAADQLVGDFRLMQSYALGAKKLADGTVPSGGWCINLFSPKDRYILFADKNGDSDYDNGEIYKEIILRSSLEVKAGGFVISLVGGGTANRNQMDVCYLPPDPAVSVVGYTGGTRVTGNASMATIRDKNTGKEKKIYFNSFGLIDVE